MDFSWIAFWVTIAFWLAQAVVSFREGTFSLRQLRNRKVAVNFHGRYYWQHLPMSFLNNWAVSIGDLVLFPMINALVVPYLLSYWWPKEPKEVGAVIMSSALLVGGYIISYLFHRAWWKHDENLGHVFVSWDKSNGQLFFWDQDLAKAGWVHFVFMGIQAAIILGFILTPMPGMMVWWVGVILSLFVIIQNIQAVVIQKGYSPKFLFVTLAELFAIWAIVIVKILIA